jgi:hypothetical protein
VRIAEATANPLRINNASIKNKKLWSVSMRCFYLPQGGSLGIKNFELAKECGLRFNLCAVADDHNL